MVQISLVLLSALPPLMVQGKPTVFNSRSELESAGYNIVPLVWKGVVEEGKPAVYLSGEDIHDIEKQAAAINPAFSMFNSNSTELSRRAEQDLQGRQTMAITCDQTGLGPAGRAAIQDGIQYLMNMQGEFCNSPRSCGRVSCSFSSGIWYCNDNDSTHCEPCNWVGGVASDIYNKCNFRDGTSGAAGVEGEAHDYRAWGTYVGKGNC